MALAGPDLKNSEQDLRKIGLELEFSGLELVDTAEIIQELYGGEISKNNRYHYSITGTDLGNFEVELDARILKKMAGTDFFEKWDLDIDEKKLKDSIGDILDRVAKSVVPLEIVMPPLSADKLDRLELLRSRLQKQKAKGTESSWMHAFGLHINIEVPDLEVQTLVDYLKSFFILYPWLLIRLDIDLSRRLSPFIDHFPDDYVQLVLDPEYRPSEKELIEDYLTHTSTRNRPLDMMPILALLNEDRVAGVLEGEKNKPRPTFHYRLPNSRINDPEWSFSEEVERWYHVEKLRSNHEMLNKLSRLYLLREKETLVSFRKEWAQTVEILLDLDEK